MPWWRLPVVLVASLQVGGCASTPSRAPRGSLGLDLDSATSSCRQNPALCAKVAGEPPVVPLARTARVLATAGAAGEAALKVLDAVTTARIDQALKECADEARSQVLLRRFGDRSPTPKDCRGVVGVDGKGNSVTLAMQLGEEMHRVALACAKERLNALRPRGFSLEPRYRYDRETRKLSRISPEEEHALLRQDRARELLGSLVPDIVIHAGDPLRAERVYDFKFPCINGDEPPDWRWYPEGHLYGGHSQGEMYEEALKTKAWRIAPRWGVY